MIFKAPCANDKCAGCYDSHENQCPVCNGSSYTERIKRTTSLWTPELADGTPRRPPVCDCTDGVYHHNDHTDC